MSIRTWHPVLLAGAFSMLGACGEPCVDLAKQICRCQPTDTLQQACTQRVDSENTAKKASTAEQERCAELQDSCSCEALAAGDLAACGLAKDSGFSAGESAPSNN